LYEGYYDQQLGSLDPKRTAIDEVRSIRGELSVDAARQYLARFRLHGDDPFRRVESLSGGERSRLALAKLLLEPKNLLFFDEPTNHLDIFATKILEEALLGFEGTVVLVSHDRRLLENVTTRTIVFSPEGAGQSAEGGARKLAGIYPGGFADYWQSLKKPANPEPLAVKPAQAPAPAAAPAARHQERREAQRELERKRRRAERLEEQIAEAESQLADLRDKLRAAPGDDWERLHELCDKEQALVRKVDTMLKEWESLSLELEKAAERPAAEQGGGA
jgi:ATP-binding cassette subfamily F protein 3